MNSGDTFLFKDGREDDHLWMIISDTGQDPERLVIVRFLTWQSQYDQACVLQGGEHPFVKHATCVDYFAATLESNATLEQLRTDGNLKVRIPLSSELLGRIRACAITGDISTKCIALLGDQKLVDYP